MKPASIRIENLSVSFSGQAVIRNLSFDIPTGGPTFLLGRSGSGKTTLLRAINRLNECYPKCETQGSVSLKFDGAWMDAYARDIAVEDLRRRVGMVFQNPNVLPLSIERNIRLPLEVALSLSPDESRQRVEQALRDVHLWEEVKNRLAAPSATLSGGQQQRLCLARALALQPHVLLLDEPTASLDFKAAQQIEELLIELKSHYTLVVVSHSLGQANRLAEQVFALRDGSQIESVPENVFRDRDRLLATMGELF